MFWTIFREDPDMPDSWNLCHLWAAQIAVAANIASLGDSYKKIRDKTKLTKKIIMDIERSDSFARKHLDCAFFPDDAFRQIVMKGIADYLDRENEHLFLYIRDNQSLMPVPRQKKIRECLKKDPQFSSYILGQDSRKFIKKMVYAQGKRSAGLKLSDSPAKSRASDRKTRKNHDPEKDS